MAPYLTSCNKDFELKVSSFIAKVQTHTVENIFFLNNKKIIKKIRNIINQICCAINVSCECNQNIYSNVKHLLKVMNY